MKADAPSELLQAIQVVMNDGVYLGETLRAELLRRWTADAECHPPAPWDQLRHAELEALLRVALFGDPDQPLPESLNGEGQRLYRRLGCSSDAEVAARAAEFLRAWLGGRRGSGRS
jgi:DNA-binding NarL/FixJ family response regulator